MFFLAGCNSCHMSPGQTDPFRLGGGMELKTPFGSFFPPNISPDPADGIGKWTAADFANALMAGVSPRREHYFPAFPYPSYRHMSLKDIRDLFAFVRTTEPVEGRAPPHAVRFPFSIRRAVGLWKLLYLTNIPQPLEVAPSDPQGLGRYLVEGPGHCAECHSPRDFLGGIIASRRLTGGPLPDGKGKAPDITAAGLADWSESDVADALVDGLYALGRHARRPDGRNSAQPLANARRGPGGDRPLLEDLSRGLDSLRSVMRSALSAPTAWRIAWSRATLAWVVA